MQLLLSHELEIPGASRLSPAELRGHMEERFAWAVSRGQAVCALVCEPIGLERVERQSPGLGPKVLSALARTLEPAFRAAEAVVSLEEGRLVVLLVGLDLKHIETACQEWIGGAKELRIDGQPGPLRIGLRLGYGVSQPGKRLFLDTLLQVARAGLDVARYRGAGACVHTMLYDIVQDRLERERGTPGLVVAASAPLAASEPVKAVVPAPPLQRAVNGSAPDRKVAAPPTTAPARGNVPTDMERRERELTEALDTQRRENDALRARVHALESPEGEQDSERVDLLERRLAKVVRTLEETEDRLARVLQESAVDSGICSHPVEGLTADTPHCALKIALMQQIFEANLKLRELARMERLGETA